MSRAAQVILLTLATFLSFAWLNIPELAPYSLQAFAACILAYFFLKKLNKSKLFPVLPKTTADELTLTLFAILLLVGATGLTSSLFFPLIYLYLFFLSISLDAFTAIAISLELILFFYAQIETFTNPEIAHLISLPLLQIFFLFARHQYQEAKKHKQLVEIESQELVSFQDALQYEDLWQGYLINFISQFLKPRLEILRKTTITLNPTANQALNNQLNQIQLEIEKLIRYVKQKNQQTSSKTTSCFQDSDTHTQDEEV